jgi:hypothetical protein
LKEKKKLIILTPIGMLGYGIPEKFFWEGMKHNPDVISIDSGSTDSGPQKLGLGDTTCTRHAYKQDLDLVLKACNEHKTPVYISSAGGDGTNRHVDFLVEIVREIASENGYHFNLAAIYADLDKNFISEKMAEGRVHSCGPVEELTEEELEAATVVVAQMGVEPFIKAIKEAPEKLDIIISGRAYDPVPVACTGIMEGFDPGLCWHMGKIMECGAQCAVPNGNVLIGTLYEDSFDLEPANNAEICTEYSVAAHTLYEKSHPYLLPGPGGTLDLSGCKFEQVSDRVVKVSGSKFVPVTYTVKMEGSRIVGFRTICVAGVRDPILISQIDSFLEGVVDNVRVSIPNIDKDSKIIFHVYGKDGVMGELEPDLESVPKELCIIIEAVSIDQDRATAICSRARTCLLHNPYPGKIATAGNIGLPFTPLEIKLGPVCKFNVYHTIELDNPCEVFPIKYMEV